MPIKRVSLVYYVEIPDYPEFVSASERIRQTLGHVIDAAREAIRDKLAEISDPTAEQVRADSWDGLYPYNSDDERNVLARVLGLTANLEPEHSKECSCRECQRRVDQCPVHGLDLNAFISVEELHDTVCTCRR